jgi:hypothetical protein
MIWLLVGALALGLLYFWLLGHWFARVLVFLALIPCLIMAARLFAEGYSWGYAGLFVLAFPAAWLVAGVPIWVRKRVKSEPFVIPYPR